MPKRDTWHVRIQDISGNTHGAGVLLNRYQVLTCARVVAAAMGVDDLREAPVGELRVDFTAHGLTRGRWRAWVGAGGWIPPRAGDLAVLEIAGEPPPTVVPARLRPCKEPGNRNVDIHGYSPVSLDMLIDDARIVGSEGSPELWWVQIDSRLLAQYRYGFSGAGVVDRGTGDVIGCLIDTAPAESTWARMLPMEVAARLLPGLGGQLSRFERIDQDGAPRVLGVPSRLTSGWGDKAHLISMLLTIFEGQLEISQLELIVSNLTTQFGTFLSIQSYSGIFDYLDNLLGACREQPGAMRELYKLLLAKCDTRGQADIEEMRPFFDDVDLEPLLTLGQRRELYKLIADFGFAEAADAYVVAAGPTGPPLPPYASDPVSMARELEATNVVGGLPPVVRFAEELAHRVPGRAIKIREWTNNYAAQDPRIVGLIDDCRRSGPQAMGRSALVLKLKKYSLNSNCYQPTAWLQHTSPSKCKRSRNLYQAETGYELASLPELIDGLLSHVRRPPSGNMDPVVEFVIPRGLLDHDFDQWWAGGVLPRRLGEGLPVVVRSLERWTDSEVRRRWLVKWGWLMSRGRDVHPSAVRWLWGPHPSLEALAEEVGGQMPVCVALGFPVPMQDSLDMDDEISITVRAGMPIMMWCRMACSRADYRTLENLLNNHGLLDLPDLIRTWRSGAHSQPEDRLRRNLTLLYDDPGRIP